ICDGIYLRPPVRRPALGLVAHWKRRRLTWSDVLRNSFEVEALVEPVVILIGAFYQKLIRISAIPRRSAIGRSPPHVEGHHVAVVDVATVRVWVVGVLECWELGELGIGRAA